MYNEELNNSYISSDTTGVIKSRTETWMWVGHVPLLGAAFSGLNGRALKAYGYVRTSLCVFTTSALSGGKWPLSRFGHLTAWVITSDTFTNTYPKVLRPHLEGRERRVVQLSPGRYCMIANFESV